MKERIHVEDLVIEVTRDCNMQCEHCLRGPKENIDINPKYVYSLFSQLSSIDIITFTGGEPSLVSGKISDICRNMERFDLDIANFYIATNAYEVNKDFIYACIDWWLQCSENEVSRVEWSNDQFHEPPNPQQINLLSGLSFAGPKYQSKNTPYHPYYMINEGNAVNLSFRKKNENKLYPFKIEVNKQDNKIHIYDNILYLNAMGELIAGCDWSYESQRTKREIFICNVKDFSVDKIIEYNKQFNFDNK